MRRNCFRRHLKAIIRVIYNEHIDSIELPKATNSDKMLSIRYGCKRDPLAPSELC
jgi:hypothetical protein